MPIIVNRAKKDSFDILKLFIIFSLHIIHFKTKPIKQNKKTRDANNKGGMDLVLKVNTAIIDQRAIQNSPEIFAKLLFTKLIILVLLKLINMELIT